MRIIVFYFLFIFFIVALYGFAFSMDKPVTSDGKKIFTEQKCSSCHNLEVEGIVKKGTPSKNTPPDLSKIGSKVNKTQLANYLQKKESLNDKKHPAIFKGSEEELNALSKWLTGLKKSDPTKQNKTETTK